MRIMALDVGEKRIGMAISDELQIIASGMDTMERTNAQEDLDRIKILAQGNKVGEIVVGLPISMSGKESEKTVEVREFAEQLKSRAGVPVVFWDERLTTREAERLLIDSDMSREKRRKLKDKMAAQLILQGYLSAKKG